MQPVNHSPGSASAFSKYCPSPWLSAVKDFAKQRSLSYLEDIIGWGGIRVSKDQGDLVDLLIRILVYFLRLHLKK